MNINEIIKIHYSVNELRNFLDERIMLYALKSLPFTYNRIGYNSIHKRIINIIKGKLAEKIFYTYCYRHKIGIDLTRTKTPYYKKDRNDFLFNDWEFDLKNNYIVGPIRDLEHFYTIPCIVPVDQFNKKIYNHNFCYIFTFIETSNYNFFSYDIPTYIMTYLSNLCEYYGGFCQDNIDNSVKIGLNEIDKIDYKIKIESPINFYILGIIRNKDFNKFIDYCPQKDKYNYLRTKIYNKKIDLNYLTSFNDYFKHTDRFGTDRFTTCLQ